MTRSNEGNISFSAHSSSRRAYCDSVEPLRKHLALRPDDAARNIGTKVKRIAEVRVRNWLLLVHEVEFAWWFAW